MFAIRSTLKSGAVWIVAGFTCLVGAGLATAGGVLWLAEFVPLHAALALAGFLWIALPLAVALSFDRKKRQLAEATQAESKTHYGTLLVAASAGLAMAQGRTEDAAILFRELDPK